GDEEVTVAPSGHESLADVTGCRSGEAPLRLAGAQIPDPGRIVGAGPHSSGLREEAPVVQAEGHTIDSAGMPAEHDPPARDGVPDLAPTIHAAGDDAPAMGVEGRGVHDIDMAVEPADLTAGRHLPQPDTPVLAARGKPLAIGAEGNLLDKRVVALEDSDRVAGGKVPEPDRVVPATRGEPLAIGAEGQAGDPLGMARQGLCQGPPNR